jgi:hypothetical protein
MAKKRKQKDPNAQDLADQGEMQGWGDQIREAQRQDQVERQREEMDKEMLDRQDAEKMGAEIGRNELDPSADAETFREWADERWQQIRDDNPELAHIEENHPEHAEAKEQDLRELFDSQVAQYAQERGLDDETIKAAGFEPGEREAETPAEENALNAPDSMEGEEKEAKEAELDQPEQEEKSAHEPDPEPEPEAKEQAEKSDPDATAEAEASGAGGGPDNGRPLSELRREAGIEAPAGAAQEAGGPDQERALSQIREEQQAARPEPELEDEGMEA